MSLKLGVPSKGRLQDQAFEWFAERGVALERSAAGREYAGRVDGLPDVELAGYVSEINLEPVDYRGDVTYPVVVTLDETHPRLKLGMTTQVELLRDK